VGSSRADPLEERLLGIEVVANEHHAAERKRRQWTIGILYVQPGPASEEGCPTDVLTDRDSARRVRLFGERA
jgi:hypothetical protein